MFNTALENNTTINNYIVGGFLSEIALENNNLTRLNGISLKLLTFDVCEDRF